MEHLLAATLALNPTASTPSQNKKATVTNNQQSESQINPKLTQDKWQFTVPFLMLGVC